MKYSFSFNLLGMFCCVSGQPGSYLPVTMNKYSINFKLEGQVGVNFETGQCFSDSDCEAEAYCDNEYGQCFHHHLIDGTASDLTYTVNLVHIHTLFILCHIAVYYISLFKTTLV